MSDLDSDYRFLRDSAGVIDVSSRGRVCITGADRVRFLNGQITNNVKDLAVGQGCYAALVNAKAKMQSDLWIYSLRDELLLDFEPGLTGTVVERLEKYIIADDVQVVDVGTMYGMLTVQGPRSGEVMKAAGLELPAADLHWTSVSTAELGEVYCMKNARGTVSGYDVFAPTASMAAFHGQLLKAAGEQGGGASSVAALELVRIEAGIPRFGVDMDETNLAPETGIEARAISYTKGCYIGQEVISRIRTYGQVAKSLRGLRLAGDLKELPTKGDKLFHDGKEVGYVTSAARSPAFGGNIALGYVRREHNQPGTQLRGRAGEAEFTAVVHALPWKPD